MVHRFPERHPEGLVIEIGNYLTNNPRPGHAVVTIVSATPVFQKVEQTLSSKLLIRSAALESTIPLKSFRRFSYSCAFSETVPTCL
jgi:hypothetical protein